MLRVFFMPNCKSESPRFAAQIELESEMLIAYYIIAGLIGVATTTFALKGFHKGKVNIFLNVLLSLSLGIYAALIWPLYLFGLIFFVVVLYPEALMYLWKSLFVKQRKG